MPVDPNVSYTLEPEREVPDAAPRGVATDEPTADLIVAASAAYSLNDVALSAAAAAQLVTFTLTGAFPAGSFAEYDMGDGTSKLVKPAAGTTHTYAKAGTRIATVRIDRSLAKPPLPSLHRAVTVKT